MRNPDWTRDELLVALNFYLTHRPRIPGKTSLEINELSNQLRQINAELGIEGDDTFRNTNGVYMKLMNFRRFDPDYKGDGLSGGSKEEEVVWQLYANKPEELNHIVSSILSFSSTSNTDDKLEQHQSSPEIVEAEEGKLLTRVHTTRERNAALTLKKKNHFKQTNGRLFCEVCGFDFENKYGQHGVDFIECHHTRPVSQYMPGEKTHINDLVLLCSNCHRMIHRRSQWLSVEELKARLIK